MIAPTFFQGFMSGSRAVKPAKISGSFIYHVQNHSQGGGFSAAVGSEDSVNISFFDAEAQVVNGGNFAKSFGEVVQA